MIRNRIIACFKGTGADPGLVEVAARLGIGTSTLLSLLSSEPPLDNLAGLSIEEAKRVMKQFAGHPVFTADLEKAVTDFDKTQGDIRDIEKRARGEGTGHGE